MSRAKELRRNDNDMHGMVVEPRGMWVEYGPAAKIIRELETKVKNLKAYIDTLESAICEAVEGDYDCAIEIANEIEEESECNEDE